MMSEEQRAIEDAKWEAGKEQRKWDRDIAETDSTMSRAMEDIIDSMDDVQRGRLNTITLNKYLNKKLVRARMPKK